MRSGAWWGPAAVLLLACGGAAAGNRAGTSCSVDSDYDFSLSERSVIFVRQDGTPRRLVMRQGRLFVDDRWVALSGADRRRVAEYEREARAVVPLAQEVGRDATRIAFIALGEVATGFSNDPAATRRKLDQVRRDVDAQLARSISPNRYRSDELGLAIAGAVREVLPTLVGDIVGGSLRAAFSGDIARLQRLENLDTEIDALVRPHADRLERSAAALCGKMRRLDDIDNALEYRLPDGRPLDLLRVRYRHKQATDGA